MSSLNPEIYLDNNATTRALPEVRDTVAAVLGDGFGNPSSVHSAGDRARAALNAARTSVADLIGAAPEALLFTSNGTEANNWALRSVLTSSGSRPRLITTSVEHSSIIKMAEALLAEEVDVVFLPPDDDGHVKIDSLKKALTSQTALVSIQWVNNETGVIQPVEEIGRLCRAVGVLFHTDAAQALGKVPIHCADLPVDFLSITAHKIHGPQGVGALYGRDLSHLRPMHFGGPQESGLRAGTENLPGIAGFGKAAELRSRRFAEIVHKLAALRDRFEDFILHHLPGTLINGDPKVRVANTTNLRFPDVDGEALVVRLDQAGIRCSQSSACTNQRPEPSYVLRAMGLSETEAYSSVRFSVSEFTTEEEVDVASAKVVEICRQLQAFESRRRPALKAGI